MSNNQPIQSDRLRVSITLTAQQMHVIREISKEDYRSMDQMIQILLYLGFESFQLDHSLYVERMPDDPSTVHSYTPEELSDMMAPIIPTGM